MIDLALRLRQAVDVGDVPGVRAAARALLDGGGHRDPEIRSVAGAALLFAGEPREALELLPDDAHMIRAKALIAVGRLGEAWQCLEAAERAGERDTRSLRFELVDAANKAGRRFPTGTLDAFFEQSASDPARDACHERLRRGDLAGGIRMLLEYLDGLGSEAVGARHLDRIGGTIPRWAGQRVDHLVALSIAGFGDFLQFGRYLPRARERCRRMTIVIQRPMQRLALLATGADAAVGPERMAAALQAGDAYCTVFLELADCLGDGYGVPLPIVADDAAKLTPGVRHVGLCWAASGSGAARSIPFAALEPLRALPGVEFHSLQVGAAERACGPWVTRHPIASYDDTANLIAALDAVVCVDTSVAHLAASMGKPTHIILTARPDWRWQLGEATPWYPSARLYRGNPAASVKRLRGALLGDVDGC